MTITDVADRLGVTTKTIMRWEKSGKISRAKRDWRGWRVYEKDDFRKLKEFKETLIIPVLALFLLFPIAVTGQEGEISVVETQDAIEITLPSESQNTPLEPGKTPFDPMKYTLGPEDVLEISVMRHPEFSGKYNISMDGKLQYKFVGDIDVNGLTKAQLEEKLRDALSVYVIAPEVNVTVVEYKSKIFYVLGEVGTPGKYYMRSETISVRDAAFQAGLPTHSAAMRKCRIISPDPKGNAKIKKVDLYSILYGGNLKRNILMKPGDVLYVPSTVMAKVIRVINPVASTVGIASSGPESVGTAKGAVDTLAK